MRWTWNRGRSSVQPLRGKLLRGRTNSFLWLLSSRSIHSKRDSTHRLQAERSDIARDHNKETKGGRHQDAYIPSRGPRGHVAPLIREVFASAVSSDSDNNKSVQYRSAEEPRGCQPGLFSKCEGMVKTVRINDRGPFLRGRVIDLNPVEASQLGFSNLAPVDLTVLSTPVKSALPR